MGSAGFGYGLFIVNLVAFPSAAIIELSILFMFYGLYFGVLSRDLIEHVSDRMATSVGVRPTIASHQPCCVVLQQGGLPIKAAEGGDLLYLW